MNPNCNRRIPTGRPFNGDINNTGQEFWLGCEPIIMEGGYWYVRRNSFDREDLGRLPSFLRMGWRCLYFIDAEGILLYIGSTERPRDRISGHIGGWLQDWDWRLSVWYDLGLTGLARVFQLQPLRGKDLEHWLIGEFNPLFNSFGKGPKNFPAVPLFAAQRWFDKLQQLTAQIGDEKS